MDTANAVGIQYAPAYAVIVLKSDGQRTQARIQYGATTTLSRIQWRKLAAVLSSGSMSEPQVMEAAS